jgi:hypothetical protein
VVQPDGRVQVANTGMRFTAESHNAGNAGVRVAVPGTGSP